MLSTSFSRPARTTNSTTSLNWFLISQHLHSKSSNELRNIIKHMIGQAPELAELVVTPSPPTPRNEHKSVFAVGGTTGEIDSEDSDMDMSTAQHQYHHVPITTTFSNSNNGFSAFSNNPNSSISQQSSSTTPAFSPSSPLVLGRKRKASTFHEHAQPSYSSSFSPVQSPSQSQKRHRNRDSSYGEPIVCVNCQAVYASERHGLHECVYHPGQVIGHVWSCCGQQGGVGGCLRTRHTDGRGVGVGSLVEMSVSGCGFQAEAWGLGGQIGFGGGFGDSTMVES